MTIPSHPSESDGPFAAHDKIVKLLKDRAHHLMDESDLVEALLVREHEAEAAGARKLAERVKNPPEDYSKAVAIDDPKQDTFYTGIGFVFDRIDTELAKLEAEHGQNT